MWSVILDTIFYIIYTLFLCRFLLLMGEGNHLPLYTDWSLPISLIYQTTDFLGYIVYGASDFLTAKFPSLQSQYAPVGQISAFGKLLAAQWMTISNAPPVMQVVSDWLTKQTGYLDWLCYTNILFFACIRPGVIKLIEFCQNTFWALFIEMSYSQKKQKQFKDALGKRSVDLMKMNIQYHNLTEETSKLKESVITDELTKVFNKRFFLDRIQQEFQKAKQDKSVLGIIMIDIDHFKKLNDTYGHLMGDKVLQQVAHAAKLATPGKAYCCRFGGEEFSVIVPGKSFDEVQAIAKEILKQLPLLSFAEDPQLKVTCSEGVCYSDFRKEPAQKLENFEALIKLADDELYKAKLGGRNRICAIKLDS